MLPSFPKAIVMLITAAIFAVGMYGTLQIKVDFDPVAVLPPRSQLKLFVDEMNVRYPTNGFGAFIYTGERGEEDTVGFIYNMSGNYMRF